MAQPTPQDDNPAVGVLSSLLRGEISAAETYKQALDKIEDQPVAEPLRQIQQHHGQAIDRLTTHIRQLGGEPNADSGVWGIWAKAVEGSANLLGMASAIRALQTGEGHGLDEYRSALNSGTLPSGVQTEIRKDFIPRQETHIDTLARLAAATST